MLADQQCKLHHDMIGSGSGDAASAAAGDADVRMLETRNSNTITNSRSMTSCMQQQQLAIVHHRIDRDDNNDNNNDNDSTEVHAQYTCETSSSPVARFTSKSLDPPANVAPFYVSIAQLSPRAQSLLMQHSVERERETCIAHGIDGMSAFTPRKFAKRLKRTKRAARSGK